MKSILLWIILIMQIALTFYLIQLNNERTVFAIISCTIFFSTVTIPGLVLHFNYLVQTYNATLIFRYDSITMVKNQKSITLQSSEIEKVIFHGGPTEWKLPWWGYSWFELIDLNGNSIKVNCYLLEIGELWQPGLSRKISSKKVEDTWSILPLMS